eukprot:10594152-Heterocapsa_arctica.AAC.1
MRPGPPTSQLNVLRLAAIWKGPNGQAHRRSASGLGPQAKSLSESDSQRFRHVESTVLHRWRQTASHVTG